MEVYVINTKVGKRYIDAKSKEDITVKVQDYFKKRYMRNLEAILESI